MPSQPAGGVVVDVVEVGAALLDVVELLVLVVLVGGSVVEVLVVDTVVVDVDGADVVVVTVVVVVVVGGTQTAALWRTNSHSWVPKAPVDPSPQNTRGSAPWSPRL